MLESVQIKLKSQIDMQVNVASRIETQMELIRTDVSRNVLSRGAASVRRAHMEKALEGVNETINFLQSFHDQVEKMINKDKITAV